MPRYSIDDQETELEVLGDDIQVFSNLITGASVLVTVLYSIDGSVFCLSVITASHYSVSQQYRSLYSSSLSSVTSLPPQTETTQLGSITSSVSGMAIQISVPRPGIECNFICPFTSFNLSDILTRPNPCELALLTKPIPESWTVM